MDKKVIASEPCNLKEMAVNLIKAHASQQFLQEIAEVEQEAYQISQYIDWLHEVSSSDWGWDDDEQ